jgi:hypothetical protein
MSETALKSKPQQKWSIDNIHVSCETKWWGYTLHLNEDATQLLEDIDTWAGKLLGCLPGELKPVGKAIQMYLKLRNVIIKAEDRGEGVKLVSPWIMPTLLAPLPDSQHIDDSQLRWTSLVDDQDGWSDEQKMAKVFSEDGPALAGFQDKLFCVARGGGSDQSLWWMSFDGSWSTYQQIPRPGGGAGPWSACAPALAVFQNKLYCVHRGQGDDQSLWWFTFDGNNWSADQQIPRPGGGPGPWSASGVGLAVFQNKLYCVHRGQGPDQSLWWFTFDGNNWSLDQQIPRPGGGAGPWSAGAPALAVYQDQLYCVHRGADSDQSLWWFTFDGNNWGLDQQIPGVGSIYGPWSAAGPGLAVFQNKLYCLHRGEGPDQYLWWFSFDGSNWSQDTKNTGAASAYQPGIVVYRHPNGTRDQLLCVHRGVQS